MTSPIDYAMEQFRELIARVTDPSVMSREEYEEFLDQAGAEIAGMRDALRDEISEDAW